ncbi:aminoglycoside adenylyltransferase domain-containing protein [Streptomyces sp. NPDC058284]|uniref:aminoglycoside adenylyltransferase domain-containing protein n=1 Tax=unclassified Streptomyces TaxID=2593676 RepID=UPI003654BBCE
MDTLISPLLEHLDRERPGDLLGVYLYGSASTSGLRPDSDIDLLMLTRRSLSMSERAALVSLLSGISGWRGHAERFPDAAHRRPIELTSIVVDEIRGGVRDETRDGMRARIDLLGGGAPRRDFQYGEWLRAELAEGRLPQPVDDPDVVVLLATARSGHRVLRGPAFGDVVAAVPSGLLRDAVLAVVPAVLEETEGDERNALLTLARVLVTLDTGRIVSKDAAAEAVARTLAPADRRLLEHARAGYLGTVADDWTGLTSRVTALAHVLADRARRHHDGAGPPVGGADAAE